MEKTNSIYIDLIEQCKKTTDEIRNKSSVVICEHVQSTGSTTPSRTPLEMELNALLAKLQDLRDDIVV